MQRQWRSSRFLYAFRRHRPQHGRLGLALVVVVLAAGGLSLARVGQAFGRTHQSVTPGVLVFDSVTVVDVEQGRLLTDQRVVIVGNRIQAMGKGSAVALPTGAQVVPARGKYLIPGLWDMHTHPGEIALDFSYPLFIANGVTGTRNAGSDVPLATFLQWRHEILAGTRVGPPRQVLAVAQFHERHPCIQPWEPGGNKEQPPCVGDVAQARHMVDSLKAAGADMLKLYNLGSEMYFAIAAEARRVGIPFGGHVTAPLPGGASYRQVSALEASDSGASLVDHVNAAGGVDTLCLLGKLMVVGANTNQIAGVVNDPGSAARCQPLAERFRHNNTWWVPTLTHRGGGAHASRPIIARQRQFARDFWAGTVLHRNWLHDSVSVAPATGGLMAPSGAMDVDIPGGFLRVVHEVGLPIVAGTDAGEWTLDRIAKIAEAVAPPGFSLHTELALYVAEGLTPLEALQAATLNPAKCLQATDSLGTVAAGKLADLVLLDANPLADISNTTTIHAVVANGRYYDRAALDQLLATIQQTKAKLASPTTGTGRK